MAKRPTPKKRRAKSKGRAQYGVYVRSQRLKLSNRRASPYAIRASKRRSDGKEHEGITRIQA